MPEAPPLQYEPRESIVRRKWKLVAFVTLLVAVAFSLFWWRFEIQLYTRQIYLLRIQNRALSYTIDPSQKVYDENVTAMGFVKRPETQLFVRANGTCVEMWDPKVCDPLFSTWPAQIIPPSSRALLFLHERSAQDGTKLLLIAYATIEPPNQYHATESLMFHLQEVAPANDWRHAINPRNGLSTPMTGLDFADRTKPLCMFGGQVDPNDPSHFTIRYLVGEEEGILDGYEGIRTEDANGIPTPGLRLEVRQKKAGSPK